MDAPKTNLTLIFFVFLAENADIDIVADIREIADTVGTSIHEPHRACGIVDKYNVDNH